MESYFDEVLFGEKGTFLPLCARFTTCESRGRDRTTICNQWSCTVPVASSSKRPLLAPLPPKWSYVKTPLLQLQVIFRGLSSVYLSQRGGTPSPPRWTPSSAGLSQVGCTSQVGSCKPLAPSSTRTRQLRICSREVFAKLRPPRHSRCLVKGALQSLPLSTTCLSPASHCSH